MMNDHCRLHHSENSTYRIARSFTKIQHASLGKWVKRLNSRTLIAKVSNSIPRNGFFKINEKIIHRNSRSNGAKKTIEGKVEKKKITG